MRRRDRDDTRHPAGPDLLATPKCGIYDILSLIDNVGVPTVFRSYPRNYQRRSTSPRVDEVAGAADHLASRETAIGETYNVLSDPIGGDEMAEFLAKALDRRPVTIPMPEPIYRLTAKVSYVLAPGRSDAPGSETSARSSRHPPCGI